MKIKPHIISINETWLKCDQNGDYNSLFDYILVTNCRKEHKGGGVALYIQSSLSFCVKEELTLVKEKIFEFLFIDVYFSKTEVLTVGTIYRSPCNSKQSHAEFLDTISPLLPTLTTSKTNSIIMGDLNYNLLEYENNYVNTFIDTMYDNNYYSLITKPTRITTASATLIDHTWTNIFNLQTDCGILTDCIADHLPIILCVELNSPHVNESPTAQKCFNNSNIAKFMVTLENYDTKSVFQCSDVNNAYDEFIHSFSSIFNEI